MQVRVPKQMNSSLEPLMQVAVAVKKLYLQYIYMTCLLLLRQLACGVTANKNVDWVQLACFANKDTYALQVPHIIQGINISAFQTK